MGFVTPGAGAHPWHNAGKRRRCGPGTALGRRPPVFALCDQDGSGREITGQLRAGQVR
jgi:hypothetical protein